MRIDQNDNPVKTEVFYSFLHTGDGDIKIFPNISKP